MWVLFIVAVGLLSTCIFFATEQKMFLDFVDRAFQSNDALLQKQRI